MPREFQTEMTGGRRMHGKVAQDRAPLGFTALGIAFSEHAACAGFVRTGPEDERQSSRLLHVATQRRAPAGDRFRQLDTVVRVTDAP